MKGSILPLFKRLSGDFLYFIQHSYKAPGIYESKLHYVQHSGLFMLMNLS